MPDAETVRLRSGEAEAEVALRGAEPLAWRVDGRDLLWSGDPAHWSYRAPILFPVVGASHDATVRVDGQAFPMPQHGFARVSRFDLVERTADTARLRLADTAETRAHYPFAFRLDVVVTLGPAVLALEFAVTNTDARPLPYGLGFHPAFPWPLAGDGKAGHRAVFAEAERTDLPEIAPGGLLSRATRHVPMHGAELPLVSEIFTEALVFLDARSRAVRFEAPSGAAIAMEVEAFPHLAVWSRPTAPFLSLEAWTAHAEWAGGEGEFATRDSIAVLSPGEVRRHAVRLSWRP